MKRKLLTCLVTASFALCASATRAAPPSVEMTWMSIANWYFRIGDERILMDGYVTRLPESLFTPSPTYANDLYAYTKGPGGRRHRLGHQGARRPAGPGQARPAAGRAQPLGPQLGTRPPGPASPGPR